MTSPVVGTKTWLSCRQCRAFYTREKPCRCRQDDIAKGTHLLFYVLRGLVTTPISLWFFSGGQHP